MLGVFSQLLEADFGWSRSQVAAAVSLGSLGAALLAPASGVILDRWGGRWVIVGAGTVMAMAALGLTRIDSLWQFLLLYAIGRSCSVALMSPAGFVATANWFVRRRATVVGIVAVGPRAGMATFPVLVALVVAATDDWRSGWVALAIAAVVLTLPSLVLMRRRPEDMGLRPDGDPRPLDLEGLPDAPAERDFTLRQAVRTRAYWLVGGGIALTMFCGGSINFHQIPHLVEQGLSRTEAAFIVTVFSVAGAAGAVGGGALAQRITMRWTMAIALLGMAGAVLLLITATGMGTALVYAIVYGTFFGVQVSLMQVIYGDYFGRRSMGRIQGSSQPVQLLMNAAGPYLVGLWFDRVGGYDAAFVTFALLFAAAALMMALAAYPPQPPRPGVPLGGLPVTDRA